MAKQKKPLLERVMAESGHKRGKRYEAWPEPIQKELFELFDLKIKFPRQISQPAILRTLRSDFPGESCLQNITHKALIVWYNEYRDGKESA